MLCKHKIPLISPLYVRYISRTQIRKYVVYISVYIYMYIYGACMSVFVCALAHCQFLSFHCAFGLPFCAAAIKLLEFSWTENSLWRKSLSGSVYSSRNMKNRSARPGAEPGPEPELLRSCHASLPLRFFVCMCVCVRWLFYDIFIDELWFLFGAFPYTRTHAHIWSFMLQLCA